MASSWTHFYFDRYCSARWTKRFHQPPLQSEHLVINFDLTRFNNSSMWAWSSVYHTETLYVLSWSYNVDFFVCCLKILFILSIDDCDFSCGQRFVGTPLYTLHHEPWVICQFFSCRFNVAVIKSLWPRTSPFEFSKRCFLCQLLCLLSDSRRNTCYVELTPQN